MKLSALTISLLLSSGNADVSSSLLASRAKTTSAAAPISVRNLAAGKDDSAQCSKVTAIDIDLAEWVRASWFIQKQQVVAYQAVENNFCTFATYVDDSPSVPLFGGKVVSVYNFANENGVNKNPGGATKEDPFVLCARLQDESKTGELSVAPCFLPNFASGPYWVVDAGPSEGPYEWAIVSGGQPKEKASTFEQDGLCTTGEDQNGGGFWMFSRDPSGVAPSLGSTRQDTIDHMYARANALGFTTERLNDIAQEGCTYEAAAKCLGDFCPAGGERRLGEPGQPQHASKAAAVTLSAATDMAAVVQQSRALFNGQAALDLFSLLTDKERLSAEFRASFSMPGFKDLPSLFSSDPLDTLPGIVDFKKLMTSMDPCMKTYGIGYFIDCVADSGVVQKVAGGENPFAPSSAASASRRLDEQSDAWLDSLAGYEGQMSSVVDLYLAELLGANSDASKLLCQNLFGSAAGDVLKCFKVIDPVNVDRFMAETGKALPGRAGTPFEGQPECADLHEIFTFVEKLAEPAKGGEGDDEGGGESMNSIEEFEASSQNTVEAIDATMDRITDDCAKKAPSVEIPTPAAVSEFLSDVVANPNPKTGEGGSNGASATTTSVAAVAVAAAFLVAKMR